MAKHAAAEGLAYEVDRPARNRSTYCVWCTSAPEYGVGWEYLRAVQAEVFGGSYDAFEPGTLIRIGEKLGVPAGEDSGRARLRPLRRRRASRP